MRLALAIFKYFPYGGIQRDLMKIVAECQRRGHTLKIFTLRWEAPEGPDEVGLDVEIVPIVGLYRHAQYEHFADVVRKRVREEGFDLLVGFNKMPGLDVYYGGDTCYIDKALTQRKPWYRLLPRFKSFHRAERAVYDQFSGTEILTLSDIEIPLYRSHYRTPAERFHGLPPGIEQDRIAPDDPSEARARLRRDHGLAEDTLVLLAIGSGFIKKGLDRTLLAVAALPADLLDRVHLFVIGRDKADAFKRMTTRLALSDRVTFFDDGRDDVPSFLFGADALLHPAYDETAGMIIIEAMLAGLPSVVTKNCGYARYLEQHDAGLVLRGAFRQESYNAALVEVLTSERRAEWRANGIAAKASSELFALVPTAVDLLERFARERKPLLVFTLFRYFPYGGLQRDFIRIAQRLQSEGYRVLVYCLTWQGEVPEGFGVIEKEVGGVSNHAKHERFAKEVLEELEWREHAALIGFNKMPGLDFYYAADSCFEHKAQEMRSPMYRKTERYRLLADFERAVFGKDERTQIMLIAVSQREQFARYYETPEDRMTLLPPGVNRDRARGDAWQAERARVRAEFGVGDGEYLLILIGSGFITKGLDRALQAFASLPEPLAARTRMLVVGQDHPGQFLRLAASLDVEERLTLVNGRDDVPAVLQAADLMVHPAYMESGGMVLIEAVIAGLPVIATAVCGFAHYIEEAQAGRVIPEPFEQAALDNAVREALEDEAARARWSGNGVAFGREHEELYDMPSEAVRFIESRLDLVGGRGRPSGELALSEASGE